MDALGSSCLPFACGVLHFGDELGGLGPGQSWSRRAANPLPALGARPASLHWPWQCQSPLKQPKLQPCPTLRWVVSAGESGLAGGCRRRCCPAKLCCSTRPGQAQPQAPTSSTRLHRGRLRPLPRNVYGGHWCGKERGLLRSARPVPGRAWAERHCVHRVPVTAGSAALPSTHVSLMHTIVSPDAHHRVSCYHFPQRLREPAAFTHPKGDVP